MLSNLQSERMERQPLRIAALILASLALGAVWYFLERGLWPRYANILTPDALPLLFPIGLPILLLAVAAWRWRFGLVTGLALLGTLPMLGFFGSIAGVLARCWLGFGCEK